MDVRIYIHGRPQGGDVWSKDAIDDIDASSYISPFLDYDIGRDVDALMIVDRWRNSSYYTYFRHKGLMENNPRRGANAYFAITVKLVGAYCQKVSVLYNLLDRVFEAKVFGTGKIIEPYGDSGLQRFTVGNFKEKESDFAEIATIIKTNLEQVVAPYISALSQLTDTKKSAPVTYSLEDVDSPKFEKDSEQHRIIVSAQYPSFVQRVASLEEEKGNTVRQFEKASQDVNEYKQQLQDMQAELSKAKKETQTREEREAERKSDADYQSFKQERKDFQDYQRQKEDYKGYKSQKESFSIFLQYKDSLLDFSRRMAGTFSASGEDFGKGKRKNDKDGNGDSKKCTSRIWMAWTVGVIVLVALVLSVVTNIVVLHKISDSGNTPVAPSDTVLAKQEIARTDTVEKMQVEEKEEIQSYTINIVGYTEKRNNLYIDQRFPLKVNNFSGNVVWSVSSNATIVNGNVLVPHATGSFTIHGEAEGAIITDRTVTAVNRPVKIETKVKQVTDTIKNRRK